MRPSVTPAMWAGWLCVFVAAVSADSEDTVYGKLGGEVALKPGAVSATINSIMWADGPNIAIQWDGKETDHYRHFAVRGHLNTSNGVMTITGLTRNDSGVYTPEINNFKGTPVHLTVISAVPVPTVTTSCDEKTTRCTLTCGGDTAGAEPLTYRWKSDDYVEPGSFEKSHVIVKEDNASVKEFRCEMVNPVSGESSQPVANPFTPPEGLKISTGLTVFICLLTAVLLLVIFHRLKAGAWFFNKGSMPWQADFWRKHETQSRDAAESNGTTALQQKEQKDEETPTS